MKKITSLLLLSLFCSVLAAQGIGECFIRITREQQKHFNENPETVFVAFRFAEGGSIDSTSVTIVRGINPQYDSIAKTVLFESPKVYGRRVRSDECIIIPIKFAIQSADKNVSDYIYSETGSVNLEEYIDPYFLANQYLDSGNYELAAKYLKESLARGFDFYQNAETHYLLYRCLTRLNEPEEACIYLEEAKNFDSRYKKAWKKNCK